MQHETLFVGISQSLLEQNRHRIAPAVLRRLANMPCRKCSAKCWYTPAALDEAKAGLKSPVVVVCESCMAAAKEKTPYVTVELLDTETMREQAAFDASKN